MLFIVIVALAGLLLPAVFGQTVTVSPLVLFAVAVAPSFIAYLIPAQSGDDNGMFSPVFFFRLVASCTCALMFYAIYRIAYVIGA